jgi:thymidylate kinase
MAIVPGTGHRADPPAGRRATRDRIEDAGRDFFERVERGYAAIAAGEPDRVCVIDATRSVSEVEAEIWGRVRSLLEARVLAGGRPAP